LKFGRLKVVEPSPLPYKVPKAENNPAYVVLLTALPSQYSQPVGTVATVPAHIITDPAGVVLATAVPTKAVVAICVVFVPADAVGAAGVPVKVGDARGAFVPSCVDIDVDVSTVFNCAAVAVIEVPDICSVVALTSPLEPYITALPFEITPASDPSTKLSSAVVAVIPLKTFISAGVALISVP
jgi:hypothetical protein